jgi:hypothetical protein
VKREDLLHLLECREEKVDIDGHVLTVREPTAGDVLDGKIAGPDGSWLLLVHCVYDMGGNRIFTAEDVPALKAASRGHVGRLMDALNRVCARDTGSEKTESEAAHDGK